MRATMPAEDHSSQRGTTMRRLGAGFTALILGLGTALAAVSPALAAVSPAAAVPDGNTNLLIVIDPPTTAGPETRTVPLTAWLRCGLNPGANNHPFPAQACAEVINAKGDIGAIPRLRGFHCLAYHQPVAIHATGEVEGVPVSFHDVESNTGCASISHGHVFRLG
jgi:hypothetical protein